jgi:hypothetical protein
MGTKSDFFGRLAGSRRRASPHSSSPATVKRSAARASGEAFEGALDRDEVGPDEQDRQKQGDFGQHDRGFALHATSMGDLDTGFRDGAFFDERRIP